MPNAKKPRPETRSITFKDVPTEYIECIEKVAKWLGRGNKQKYTEPKATPDMSMAQLKTLALCELFHEKSETIYGVGSTDKKLERHRENREFWNEHLVPK